MKNMMTCKTCNGSGEIVTEVTARNRRTGETTVSKFTLPCHICDGEGQVPQEAPARVLQTELMHHLLLEAFKYGYDMTVADNDMSQPDFTLCVVEEDTPLYALTDLVDFIYWVYLDFQNRRFGWGNLEERINQFYDNRIPMWEIVKQARAITREKFDNPEYEEWLQEWEYDQDSGNTPCSLERFIVEAQALAYEDLPHGLDPECFVPGTGEVTFPF